jgi:DNA-directed RNA polymerase subunit RPC12/RpoP
MGRTISIGCDCGYRRDCLAVGAGMTVGLVLVPYLCRECKEVFSGNIRQKPVHCPTCNKPSKTHVKTRAGRFQCPETKYTCPKCSEKSLRFGIIDVHSMSNYMLWD